MSLPRIRKIRILALCVLAAVLLGLLGTILFAPERMPTSSRASQVTIHDSRLQIDTAHVLRGTNTYYLPAHGHNFGGALGNRFEGKLRNLLRRWGVNISTLATFTPGVGPDGRAFIVGYTFPLPLTSPACLSAELVTPDGNVIPLRIAASERSAPQQKIWNLWMLDSLPANATNYLLRLKERPNSTPLGEIQFSMP